jgi:hypothetical protein
MSHFKGAYEINLLSMCPSVCLCIPPSNSCPVYIISGLTTEKTPSPKIVRIVFCMVHVI